MEFHQPPSFPRGFTCASTNCGLKQSAPDLALFFSEVPAAAAALFTRNQFPGAPVQVGRELIQRGELRAIVVNSRISNVGTGAAGIENAHRMGAAAARELGIDAALVLMSSTGVIGVPLPIEKIERGLQGMKAKLQRDPMLGALAIMTTDTRPKAISTTVGSATITIIAKGAGMIEPNMATMLCYIFTDAAIDAATLDRLLREAAHDSLNMLSIDSDTSTSDTCVILANRLAGRVDLTAFGAALRAACIRMTEIIARDGEGATKLLRAHVSGALSEAEARTIAKAIINSPLVKTMAYGADPNVGRLLMAIGKNFTATIVRDKLDAWINRTQVVASGMRAEFDDDALRVELRGDPVDIRIELGVGTGAATAYGCDLTEGYINENAAYYSS
ncbi:MAG: bifunctional glutamate N-acetyltransferase/amino-acid acetyltransferase ArgJ [Gemmatimonadota bacterium]